MKHLIFIDLDGVMVDLDRGLLEKRGYAFPTNQSPEIKRDIDVMWDDVSRTPDFWSTLPPMLQFEKLYEKILTICPRPIILSATPECYGFDDRHEACKLQKIAWVHKNLGAAQAIRAIITKSKLKQNFMHIEPSEQAILVDDHADNINRWIHAGGVGVLHHSVEGALDQLDKL